MNSNRQLVGSPVDLLVATTLEAPMGGYRHHSLLDKLAMWISWGAAAGIFLTLGWMAMAPTDPYGAVSLLFRGNALSMWIQAAGLAVVTSAIATLLVGRSLPYAGPFASALGLAVVSLRGRTAESLLIAAPTSGISTNSLAIRMSFEVIAWIGVILLALAVANGVARWCFPRTVSQNGGRLIAPKSLPAPAFVGVALTVALLAFSVLGAGMHSREIRHTQVCFVVAASVWLGCYAAYRVVPARGILWYVAAVMFMGLGGYWWAAFQSDPPTLPVSVPPSNFLRVLPIQFVALGVVAAIAAYWSNLSHQGETGEALMEASKGGES